MKQLYYECFAGISGDMNLGALVDLGVNFDALKDELSKLGLDDEFNITAKSADKQGIFGTKIDVVDLNEHHNHTHEHDHTHNHSDEQKQDHAHHHSHDNLRTFAQIKTIIENSRLSERVKKDSVGIFKLIATAEGKVHRKQMDDVHFHEVGAIDSIVDIVGTAICMEILNITSVICNSIELGSGFIKCAHGKMPVPAPATAEILLGLPVTQKVTGYEMTTPTGAAIIKYYRDPKANYNNILARKIGYGLGTRNLDIPNLVRVTLCNDQKKN